MGRAGAEKASHGVLRGPLTLPSGRPPATEADRKQVGRPEHGVEPELAHYARRSIRRYGSSRVSIPKGQTPAEARPSARYRAGSPPTGTTVATRNMGMASCGGEADRADLSWQLHGATYSLAVRLGSETFPRVRPQMPLRTLS